MANQTQLTPALDLFGKSKELFLKNIKVFAVLYIFPLIKVIGDVATSKEKDKEDMAALVDKFRNFSIGGKLGLVGFGLAVLLITGLVGLIIQTMIFRAELEASNNKQPQLKQLWTVAKKYWLRVLGLMIVIVVMFIGGILLLVVPGLIVLRRYFLAPYYLIDKDLSISEALRQSARDSKPVSGSIWRIIGVYILLGLPGFIPVVGPFIAFALMALYSIAPALRYREIQQLKPAN